MNPTLRRLLTFAALLAAFTVIRFPYSDLIEDELREAQIALARKGQHFSFETVDYSFPKTLSLSKLRFKIATQLGPVPVSISHLSGSLSLLRLLTTDLSADIYAELYGGEISGLVSKGVFSDESHCDLTFNNLQLQQHPLGKLYKVNANLSGNLTASADLQQNSISTLKAELTLEQGYLPPGIKIAGMIKLPEVSNITAKARLVSDQSRVVVEDLTLNSTAANLRLSGSFLAPWIGKPENDYDFSISLELSDKLNQSLGGFLALAAGKNLDYRATKWEIKASRRNKEYPQVKMHPIE